MKPLISVPKMTTKRPRPKAWCVLDATASPAVMRCKHCHATQPVALPGDLVMLAKKSKVFTKAHGLCHVSLKQLEARIEELEERIWQSALPIRAERTMKAEVFMLKNVVLDRRKNNRARLAGKN